MKLPSHEIVPPQLWNIVMKSSPHNYEISQWNRHPPFMKYCNEIAPPHLWNRRHLWISQWNRHPTFMKSSPHNYEISQWNRPPTFMKYCNEIITPHLWNIAMKSSPHIYEIVAPDLWNKPVRPTRVGIARYHNKLLDAEVIPMFCVPWSETIYEK